MSQSLHYGIIGLGPVGITLMAHLAQSGAKTSALVLEKDRADTLRTTPLQVTGQLKAEGPLGFVTDSLDLLLEGCPDLLLIATKSCNNNEIIDDLKATGSPNTIGIVCCQNGLGVEDEFRLAFPRRTVLRMVMNLGCSLVSPNAADVKFFKPHFLSPGEGRGSELAQALAQDLSHQGYTVGICPDIATEVFKKTILNSSLGTVCAITGLTMAAAMRSKPIRKVIRDLVHEGIDIGKALKLNFDDGFLSVAESYFMAGDEHKPSMAVDIELGRSTENEQHCGAMVEMARQLSISAPVTQTIYSLMKDLEGRASQPKKI